jgi:outer membrane murein-binding lipoprotein Lpp
MDARVSQLETHMDYMRESVSDIRASQRDATKAIAELASKLSDLTSKLSELATKVETLPTKDDLWSWKIQWLAIALAAVAFIVGGIVGGLDWIKTH